MRALIIRRWPYGESDLVLRLLTERNELVSAFAAGARKSRKRFPHQFDQSGVYEVNWQKEQSQRQLVRIDSAELIEFAAQLSSSLESWSRWLIVLEWTSHQEEGADFERLLQLRSALRTDEGSLRFHEFFLEEMLNHGLSPETEICVECGQGLKAPSPLRFDLQKGGATHLNCSSGIELSVGTRDFLARRLESSPQLSELDQITVPFLTQQLGRELKAQSFFSQLTGQDRPTSLAPSQTAFQR